jgi:basic amino acid/polyamine antiporter, APA family
MNASEPVLQRRLGLVGATVVGLGSILGTGVFVSIGIAAGITGPSVVLAIVLAGILAVFNGLSSAQLAAAHPVSGGTYAYGYRYLNPTLGFTAGWLFILAKSASAATAALGFAGYALNFIGLPAHPVLPWVAFGVVVVFTGLMLLNVTRTTQITFVMVLVTVVALGTFVVAGARPAGGGYLAGMMEPFFRPELDRSTTAAFLNAVALMFVAYTGYGRIATLGEEVKDPSRTIPLAVILTLSVSMVLYAAVAFISVSSVGASTLGAATDEEAAPLEMVARAWNMPGIAQFVALGAITAMMGVLLNLMLGLSRVVLAMGRQKDLPAFTARLNRDKTTPYVAVLVVGVIVALLVSVGDVRATWSFSAFTVLFYYAITNLAALNLPPEQRRYPVFVPVMGLVACGGLAFWVDAEAVIAGLVLIGIGLALRRLFKR